MKFPPEFQFNQGNLQNFMDCRRRFYLGSIRRLAWPAVESEPMAKNEHLSQQGAAFHRLVQQSFLGVPRENLIAQAGDETLRNWLSNFLTVYDKLPGIGENGAQCLPEINLTSQVSDDRVAVKYDLLVILPDRRLFIYDWKTSRTRTRRSYLAERMQTKLYRYLLAKIGARLTGHPLQPEQISMAYWFAGFPGEPEVFSYSDQQYKVDAEDIQQTISTIHELVRADTPEKPGLGFPLTLNEKRCAFCIYRSLCERGLKAGNAIDLIQENELALENDTDLSEVEFTLEQIAEIEF